MLKTGVNPEIALANVVHSDVAHMDSPSMGATKAWNPLYPIEVERKPTAHECKCQICNGDIDKEDLRLKLPIRYGYRTSRTYYYHVHCFIDKFIEILQAEGYDTSQYVAGRLFQS